MSIKAVAKFYAACFIGVYDKCAWQTYMYLDQLSSYVLHNIQQENFISLGQYYNS